MNESARRPTPSTPRASQLHRPRIPFWATRQCRWLLGGIIMVLALGLVLRVEIIPTLDEGERSRGRFLDEKSLLSMPVDPSDARFRGMLAGVEDEGYLGSEPASYRELREYLIARPSEALAGEALLVPAHLFRTMPGDLRGRVCTVSALFLKWESVLLEDAASSTEYVYRSWLLDEGANQGYVVDLLEPPAKIGPRTLVKAQGIFYRNARYVGQKDTIVQAPHLLARALEPIVEAPASSPFDSTNIVIALVVLGAAWLLLAHWMVRSRRARAQALALARGRPPPPHPRSAAPSPAAAAAAEPPEHTPTSADAAQNAAASAAPPGRPALGRPAGGRPWRPAPRAAPVRGLSAGQKRYLVFVALTGLLLAGGYSAMKIYRRLRPEATEAVDPGLLAVEAFARASEAHRQVLDRERKVWERTGTLAAEDDEAIRERLADLEEESERMLELLEQVRALRPPVELETLRARGRALLQVRLWILDAWGILERDPSVPADAAGDFIPFHRLLDRAGRARRAADEALGDGDPPAAAMPARVREAAGDLRLLLEEAAQLERWVIEGLERDAETIGQIPEVARLREETAHLERSLQRAERHLGGDR